MPNKPKTPARSFRFTEPELDLMDRLGKRLAPPGLKPYTRTDVLRLALGRLAESVEGRKNSRKNG
jgi:hypothetical protein